MIWIVWFDPDRSRGTEEQDSPSQEEVVVVLHDRVSVVVSVIRDTHCNCVTQCTTSVVQLY